jgi:lipid II:glycine glycyltransferase (peptidoglycan interpeptide bridge formation enzyme)
MNKEKYNRFCKETVDIPIFFQPWWLDTVCGTRNWDVVLAMKGDSIVAAWPYFIKKAKSFLHVAMPTLTQVLGPYIKYPLNQNHTKKMNFEKKVITQLIDQLPKADKLSFSCHYSLTNWLPFYWKGYEATPMYTYVIEGLTDLDQVLAQFKSNVRNKLRKASNLVKVCDDLSLDEFYTLNMMTFERQGLKPPYTFQFIKKLDNVLVNQNRRKIFFAFDDSGKIHSSLYLIWDDRSSYVHMVGENPKLRNSGAGIFLIWEAIKFTKNELKLDVFDFEGSMIEGVESVRRACGGVQKQYFSLIKCQSKMLLIKRMMTELWRM